MKGHGDPKGNPYASLHPYPAGFPAPQAPVCPMPLSWWIPTRPSTQSRNGHNVARTAGGQADQQKLKAIGFQQVPCCSLSADPFSCTHHTALSSPCSILGPGTPLCHFACVHSAPPLTGPDSHPKPAFVSTGARGYPVSHASCTSLPACWRPAPAAAGRCSAVRTVCVGCTQSNELTEAVFTPDSASPAATLAGKAAAAAAAAFLPPASPAATTPAAAAAAAAAAASGAHH